MKSHNMIDQHSTQAIYTHAYHEIYNIYIKLVMDARRGQYHNTHIIYIFLCKIQVTFISFLYF